MRPGLIAVVLAALLGAASGNERLDPDAEILTRLEDVKTAGKGVALLVFFSTECATCYADLFEMRYLVERNGWPVAVVGIAAGVREDLEVFLGKFGWPFPVVWDRKKAVFKKFGVRSAPFKVVLIGGEVVYKDDGYQDSIRRRVEVSKFLGGVFARLR